VARWFLNITSPRLYSKNCGTSKYLYFGVQVFIGWESVRFIFKKLKTI
jgi:hypothetical protein